MTVAETVSSLSPLVRDHVSMLHQLASGIDGVLVVSAFNANLTGDKGVITHHRPGDVDGMVAAIEAHSDTAGMNVYSGLQVMRRSLCRGQRGGEQDVVAVLGLVADMDADTGKAAGEYPLAPSYIVETSPGNLQPAWLFETPTTAAEAKVIARGLKAVTGSDHGTADVAHVWRIPGTMNWPTPTKTARGRAAEPAHVSMAASWDGSLVRPDDLLAAVGDAPAAPHGSPMLELGELPDIDTVDVSDAAAALLAANDVGDRSAHAARVVERLAFEGHIAEKAAALFLSATGDWYARYANRDPLADFLRLWAKYAQDGMLGLEPWFPPPRAANDNEPAGDALPEINPADWHGKPVPEREWVIDGLLPARTVTMLSGDGGVGKSLLGLQIGAAAAMGISTLGLDIKPCRVTYLGAEDEADEFQRRLVDIVAAHGKSLADLSDLRIIPMADRDALLSEPNQSGVMKPTNIWHALLARLGSHKPGLIILDTSADLYGGDEIKRGQVRAFVAMLRALAIASGAAVLLLSHPSVAGMQTGTGSSGSTAWNNSVRSRLYLTKPTGTDAHPDQRILSVMKANYGGTGDSLRLRWSGGSFVVDDGSANEQPVFVAARHDAMFVQLLSAINRTGRRVAQTKGANYAPKMLVTEPGAYHVTVKDLEAAMLRLLKAGTIKTISDGPPSKPRQKLMVSAEDFSPTGPARS